MLLQASPSLRRSAVTIIFKLVVLVSIVTVFCIKILQDRRLKLIKMPQDFGQYILEGVDGSVIHLTQRSKLGRKKNECDIVIPNASVSGVHALIEVEENRPGITVLDLHSTNGTFVNGRKIQSPTHVRIGEQIRFGQNSIFTCQVKTNAMHSPDVLSPQSLASSGHYQPQLYPASPYHGHQNQSDSYAGVHPNPMPVQSPKRHPRSSYNDFADFENRGSIENPRTSYRSKPQESQLRSERELHALREELAHEKHKNAQQLRESINSVHPDMEILQRRIQVLENKNHHSSFYSTPTSPPETTQASSVLLPKQNNPSATNPPNFLRQSLMSSMDDDLEMYQLLDRQMASVAQEEQDDQSRHHDERHDQSPELRSPVRALGSRPEVGTKSFTPAEQQEMEKTRHQLNDHIREINMVLAGSTDFRPQVLKSALARPAPRIEEEEEEEEELPLMFGVPEEHRSRSRSRSPLHNTSNNKNRRSTVVIPESDMPVYVPTNPSVAHATAPRQRCVDAFDVWRQFTADRHRLKQIFVRLTNLSLKKNYQRLYKSLVKWKAWQTLVIQQERQDVQTQFRHWFRHQVIQYQKRQQRTAWNYWIAQQRVSRHVRGQEQQQELQALRLYVKELQRQFFETQKELEERKLVFMIPPLDPSWETKIRHQYLTIQTLRTQLADEQSTTPNPVERLTHGFQKIQLEEKQHELEECQAVILRLEKENGVLRKQSQMKDQLKVDMSMKFQQQLDEKGAKLSALNTQLAQLSSMSEGMTIDEKRLAAAKFLVQQIRLFERKADQRHLEKVDQQQQYQEKLMMLKMDNERLQQLEHAPLHPQEMPVHPPATSITDSSPFQMIDILQQEINEKDHYITSLKVSLEQLRQEKLQHSGRAGLIPSVSQKLVPPTPAP